MSGYRGVEDNDNENVDHHREHEDRSWDGRRRKVSPRHGGGRARSRDQCRCAESRQHRHAAGTSGEPVLRLRVQPVTTLRLAEGAGMIQKLWAWVLHPPVTGPRATTVIRVMAGGVFFWEGILKFVYVNQGVGRFT